METKQIRPPIVEEQVQVHAHVQLQAATTAVLAEGAVLAVLAERMVLAILAVAVLAVAVLAVAVLAVLEVPTFKLVGILAAKVAADTSNVRAVNSFLMGRRCVPTWINVYTGQE